MSAVTGVYMGGQGTRLRAAVRATPEPPLAPSELFTPPETPGFCDQEFALPTLGDWKALGNLDFSQEPITLGTFSTADLVRASLNKRRPSHLVWQPSTDMPATQRRTAGAGGGPIDHGGVYCRSLTPLPDGTYWTRMGAE